mgnify:CR=1 FL=1
MSERIQELAIQASKQASPINSFAFAETFAKLIVKECVNSIPLDMDHAEYLKVMRAVKNTFEVK